MTTENKQYKCVICGADVPNYEEKWAVGNFFEVMEPPFCSDKCKALIFNEREDAIAVFDALRGACESGMEIEFLEQFIRRIKAGDSVLEAIRCAYWEWDL